MSRDINATVLSNLEEDNIKYVYLVKLRFQDRESPYSISYFRVNSSPQSIYWDEAGGGDIEYKGIGNLGKIESAEEGTAVQNYTINMSVTGIDPAYIAKAVSLDYKNQPAFVYLANLDTDNTVIGGQNGPILLFAGRMDTMNIKVAKEATIGITAVSRLSDWERPRGGRYNHYTQKSYYASLHDYTDNGLFNASRTPLDKGFLYADRINGMEVYWGRQPIPDGDLPERDNQGTNPNQ